MPDENGEPTIIETSADSYSHCAEVLMEMRRRYFRGESKFGTVDDARDTLSRAIYLVEREMIEASR